jgi:hypothetical protein
MNLAALITLNCQRIRQIKDVYGFAYHIYHEVNLLRMWVQRIPRRVGQMSVLKRLFRAKKSYKP